MILRRASSKSDLSAVKGIIKELDLAYPSLAYNDFWVAEDQQTIIAIAKLEDLGAFSFLSSVGVRGKVQHRGVASALLNGLLTAVKKDVYLYTIIPEFFKKFGFRPAAVHPPNLPAREVFSCHECEPEKCSCLVRKIL